MCHCTALDRAELHVLMRRGAVPDVEEAVGEALGVSRTHLDGYRTVVDALQRDGALDVDPDLRVAFSVDVTYAIALTRRVQQLAAHLVRASDELAVGDPATTGARILGAAMQLRQRLDALATPTRDHVA